MSGRRAEVDPPAPELDEHEDVERPEPSGLDAEEVAGDDAIGLGPEELGPGRARAPRGRTELRRPEQGPYRRRAHAQPKLPELAPDPDAAPPGVLPGQPENERTDFRVDGRPSRAPAPTVGPLRRTSSRCHRRSVAGVTRKA